MFDWDKKEELLAYAYVPQVLSGKIVNQSDISGWQGMSHEMMEWNAAHPDDPPSYRTGEAVSRATSILLILAALGALLSVIPGLNGLLPRHRQ